MVQALKNFSKSLKFTYFAILIIGISSLILFSFLYSSVKNESYELKLFQIAPEAIRSSKTVEDVEKTNIERERAAQEVSPVYQFSEDISKNRQAITTTIFDSIIETKTKIDVDGTTEQTKTEAIKELKEKLASLASEEPELQLNSSTLDSMLAENVQVLQDMKQVINNLLDTTLINPIRSEDLPAARYEIEREVRLSNVMTAKLEQPLSMLARALVVPTEVENEALTEERRVKEQAAVEPIRILQGQVIVREGQVIDNEVYRQLELAGLLTDQSNVKPTIGLLLFVSFIAIVIYLHFHAWRSDGERKKKSLTIVLIVFLMLVTFMKVITFIQPEFDLLIAFLFPSALGAMLVKLLTNDRLALLTTIITAATAGVLLQNSYASVVQMEIALYILFGGITSLYLLSSINRRSTILQTSLGVSLSNLLFLSFYLLMSQTTYDTKELLFYAAAAVLSGVLSGAMTIGLLPFFESVFFILSNMRLIELSNPNHPLFKKILTETPGTYHHSIMVANLSDAACESVGANGLLARVGCYYHDIGKTVRPNYFIENQHVGSNPHDQLSPEESKDIIIAHAEDGAKLLEEHKMPKEIVDIARQHHGTSLLKFFVHKAREQGKEVNEADYRYPGPKPQTREIAIISIADSVEAAVRSMKEPNSEKIAALVDAIIRDKLGDGQFDECDISMKDLRKVKEVICETLNGIFHNRIEYPD